MGLANITGLVYLLSVPALIYIYYFSRKKKRVEISSIIPWRLLRESVVRSSLFRADLLFFLQLLLLLTLVVAACRPFWRRAAAPDERRRHLVLVIDRSASMQAADGRKTRWESARNRALRLVRRLGDGDRVTLIAAGARAEVLASAELNRAAVESALEGLSPADTPDNMAPALEMAFALLREGRGKQDAGAGGPPGRVRDEDVTVHIVTDRSGDALGIGDRGSGRKVHLERVGAPEGNTAITAIAVYGEPFTAGREVSIYVTAENFSEKTFSGSLRATADGKRIGARAVTLAPGEALTTKVGDRLPTRFRSTTRRTLFPRAGGFRGLCFSRGTKGAPYGSANWPPRYQTLPSTCGVQMPTLLPTWSPTRSRSSTAASRRRNPARTSC
jgi:hypothetical protein